MQLNNISSIPTGHIDDADSVRVVITALRALHGPDYDFALRRWHGMISFGSSPGRTRHFFVVKADQTCQVFPNLAGLGEALWPGDVFCVRPGDGPIRVEGDGVAFEVTTQATDYPAPRLVHLRELTDKPGGCAAYPGAFRREALPPVRPPADAADRRGVNRVNEHTLDMRSDRTPLPIRHCHGPVAIGPDATVNHSETAIVLPRSLYGLPEVGKTDEGRVVIYTRPLEDPSAQVVISVRPGSVIVTQASSQRVMGHAFENAFAMLIAIPGFVAPYRMLEQGVNH
ncbi:MAG: hypothetical protein DWI57_12320 [Chloroflexi bacterium]|nr:MAG: hypothetical protein DWI57_12320 [Chloroflexota bacterium]